MSSQAIKTSEQIELIEKSCRLADKAFTFILKEIKLEISEKELAKKISHYIYSHKAVLAFKPLVSFGKNTAEIHHKPTNKKLKKNEAIMLDFGAKLNGYCSDITRTIFLGKSTLKQKKIYQTVLKAQSEAIKFIADYYNNKDYHREKLWAKDVDRVARAFIKSQGFIDMDHSLGHGVGKKVHQAPRLSPKSKTELKPGMVFSIEPGIYLKNFGGVRIEDLVLIEKQSVRILTASPKKIIEL